MGADPQHLDRLRTMLAQVDRSPSRHEAREYLESHPAALGTDARLESMGGMETELALESLDLLDRGRDDQIAEEGRFALEAIVMPYHRPVVDIVKDRMQVSQLTPKWHALSQTPVRSQLEATFLSVGRINVPNLLYAGTGFIVGDGLLMTNRHVAHLFATGVGIRTVNFHPGVSAEIDFYHENGEPTTETLTVNKVEMIHPYWDLALLSVSGIPSNRVPLVLCPDQPESLLDREVIVVGYPGYDPHGGAEFQRIQNRIFRNTYYVKRMQPGELKQRNEVSSFGHRVDAITHDCSTLGGNSGSAVLLVPRSPREPVQVVGLHFAGSYLKANYAVSAHDLAMDRRVVDAGVKFGSPRPAYDDSFYREHWDPFHQPDSTGVGSGVGSGGQTQSEPPTVVQQSQDSGIANSATTAVDAGANGVGNSYSWTIPLHVTVTLGGVTPGLSTSVASEAPATRKDFTRPEGTSSIDQQSRRYRGLRSPCRL